MGCCKQPGAGNEHELGGCFDSAVSHLVDYQRCLVDLEIAAFGASRVSFQDGKST